jgi:5'-methylthioadenosine phosphorylase
MPPSFYVSERVHKTPVLDESLMKEIAAAAREEGATHENVVYWQSHGPRFETKAEVRMMANFADVVGMTLASEATLATELGIPHAMVCTVDNYAHGVGDGPLDSVVFKAAVKENTAKAEALVRRLMR